MISAKHTTGGNLLKQQKYWVPENRRNENCRLKNRTVVDYGIREGEVVSNRSLHMPGSNLPNF